MTIAIKTGAATAGRRPKMSRIPPLQWWRGERQPLLDASSIKRLRETLAKVYLLQFPRWRTAVGGNAGAAVCIGIYVASDRTSPAWLVDLVGSVLLTYAAEGCDAAALVLRHLRRRHGDARHSNRKAEA